MNDYGDLIAKAEKYLGTAQLTLDVGDYDTCVSRCYYAMFFMAEAALLTRGLRASSHKGVIGLFGEHFVKSGIFDRDLGKALRMAHDTRIVGDYGVGFSVGEDQARETLDRAREFVSRVKLYLEPHIAHRPE